MNNLMNFFNNSYDNSYENPNDISLGNYSKAFEIEDLLDKDIDFIPEDMNRFQFKHDNSFEVNFFNGKIPKEREEKKVLSKTADVTLVKDFKNKIKNLEDINLNKIKEIPSKPPKRYKLTYKIFNIQKIKKKNHIKGRMKGKLKKDYILLHTRFSQDNIIRKIKASFIEKTMNYINKEYRKYLKSQNIRKISRLIQRILPTESRKIKKSDNIIFFDTKLKNIFASPISRKYSLYDSNYNIRQINKLYNDNKAQNVIKILEMKVSEIFHIYSYDIKLDGFETLIDDLNSQKAKMKDNDKNKMIIYSEEEINDYSNKYKYIAQHLQQIFNEKKPRKKKYSKKNKPLIHLKIKGE